MDKNVPKLSILVAIYNVERYVEKCIKSILEQSFADFEVILVDDGSTDKSGEICDKYAALDARIKVIHKENGGVASARRIGLENASGKYVTFFDGDDWAEPQYYEEIMEYLADDIDIGILPFCRDVFGQVFLGFAKHYSPLFFNQAEAIEEMFKWEYFNWSLVGKIYKKDLLCKVIYLFKYGIDIGEDLYANWQVFCRASKIVYISAPYYHYCFREDSLTKDVPNYKQINDFIVVCEKCLSECQRFSKDIQKIILESLLWGGWSEFFSQLCFGRLSLEQVERCRSFFVKYGFEELAVKKDNRFAIEIIRARTTKEMVELIQSKIENAKKEFDYFLRNIKHLYIYGAGIKSLEAIKFLKRENIDFCGFVISSIGTRSEWFGKKIWEADEIMDKYGNSCGFILGMQAKNNNQVIAKLKERGFTNYFENVELLLGIF